MFPGDSRRKTIQGKKINELLKKPGCWSCLQLGGFQKFGKTLELKNDKFQVTHVSKKLILKKIFKKRFKF